MRDIFKKGKINFENYKAKIKYDFESIENELRKKILPGLVKFKNEDINFIVFLYEFFRSNRSSLLNDFILKYNQKDLSNQEEELLNSFINKNISDHNFKRNILSSIQILLYYIWKSNFNFNEWTISDVIRELTEYIEIYEPFKLFFTTNSKEFKINSLINIYNII